MTEYEKKAAEELKAWKKEMQRKQPFLGVLSRQLQTRINKAIPEKVHNVITAAIKQMTRGVFTGVEFITPAALENATLEERETKVNSRIKFYARTAAAEGAVTGAGGILLGLADFPLWLTVKMKMLFEIAALYGYNTGDLKERVYLLYIFQITFSSQGRRREIYSILKDWENQSTEDLNNFDWRRFQQEYRDYIDIAKLLQLVPGIGAPVGAVVNLRLTNKLGAMAKNAYRLRQLKLSTTTTKVS